MAIWTRANLTSGLRGAGVVALLASAVLAGGCGAGDIAFEGKIFDAVGLNNQTKAAEPKIAARAPIVIPPGLDRLPEPGSAEQPNGYEGDLAQIQDPDRKKAVSQVELERQQKEYCDKNYELAKQRGDQNADLAKGPLGDCRPSALTSFQKWNKSE